MTVQKIYADRGLTYVGIVGMDEQDLPCAEELFNVSVKVLNVKQSATTLFWRSGIKRTTSLIVSLYLGAFASLKMWTNCASHSAAQTAMLVSQDCWWCESATGDVSAMKYPRGAINRLQIIFGKIKRIMSAQAAWSLSLQVNLWHWDIFSNDEPAGSNRHDDVRKLSSIAEHFGLLQCREETQFCSKKG